MIKVCFSLMLLALITVPEQRRLSMETPTYTTTPEPSRKLYTVDQWPTVHPWPTANGLRYYIKHRHTNGLDKHGAVLRMGRRILIDEARFFAWIDSENGVKVAS